MSNGEEGKIRRILVALDASPHSIAALQAAAELARELDAELVGVFVEDINLVRLAELPLSREISYYSTATRQFGRQQAEAELRAQADRARRALAIMAQRSRLRSSFQISRGAIPAELLRAAEEADLIIIGKAGWSGRKRMGSTTRVMIAQSSRHTLIVQHGSRLGLHLGVLYDGTGEGLKAILAADNLLTGRNGYLTVLILADDVDEARRYQYDVSRWLRKQGKQATYRWLLSNEGSKLAAVGEKLQLGAMVIPGQSEAISEKEIAELIDESEIPVLLVR